MQVRLICVLTLIGVLIFSGCTSYKVNIRTFPPTEADIYLAGKQVGRTSRNGTGRISSGKKSIFTNHLLEVRKDDKFASLYLTFTGSIYSENVISAITYDREFARDVEVIFGFVDNPLPPAVGEEKFKFGLGKTFTVSNPNNFGVWVGVRSQDAGYDFVVFENSSESVRLRKGEYDVYFASAKRPEEPCRKEIISIGSIPIKLRIIEDTGGKLSVQQLDW